MPKRNKLPSVPDYTGISKNPEKMLVQKSNPLRSLSETSMTLPELKILDAYLARIDSHEPNRRCVQFEKGELEKLLNCTRMHRDELERRIDNLFQTITIRDETKGKGFTKIALFVKAECFQDDDGLWKVNLACSEEAMEYIFNIENLGYLKYRLKSVVNLTSRYSYILYLFLADCHYQGTWEVQLDDLKKMLNCNAERYNEFKFFNAEILKKCQKEINEKTDISYTYTTIKRGRNVVAISFDVERKANAEPFIDPAKLPMPESEPPKRETTAAVDPTPHSARQSSGFHSFDTDFTPEEIQTLNMIINVKLSAPDTKLANKILRAKYAECKLTCPEAEKPFAYFLTAITKMSVEEFERKKPENNDGFDADKYNIVVNNF